MLCRQESNYVTVLGSNYHSKVSSNLSLSGYTVSLFLIRKSLVINRDFSVRNVRGGNEARRLEKVMVAATDTTCKAAIKPEIFGTRIPCLALQNTFCSKFVKLQHSHAGK